MPTESPKNPQGNPEQIKQGQERLTSLERRVTKSREEIYNSLTEEEKEMIKDFDGTFFQGGTPQEVYDRMTEEEKENYKGDNLSSFFRAGRRPSFLYGRIRGLRVEIHMDEDYGRVVKATVQGKNIPPEAGEEIFKKWKNVAKKYLEMLHKTELTDEELEASKAEREIDFLIAKLLK